MGISRNPGPAAIVAVAFAAAAMIGAPARAQCPAAPLVQNFTPPGTTPCNCFIPGEQAGAIISIPPADFPIEILEVGVGWGSMFGGAPATQEQAIHVYAGGLPNPGAPIVSVPNPLLHDGVPNVFDLEPLPGAIVVAAGPVTVSVEFLNQNSGNPFAPSVLFDADGCQAGKNAVFVVPGGWLDACPQGVTGDWVFWIEYRRAACRRASGLVVAPATSGNIQLSWSASCLASDNDYTVYEGFIGSYYSHARTACTTTGATMTTITPNAASSYYLVVPTDGATEGSYGQNSSGSERPPGSPVCNSQQTCPVP